MFLTWLTRSSLCSIHEQAGTINDVRHMRESARKLPSILPTGTAKQVRTQARDFLIVKLHSWLIAVQEPFISDGQGSLVSEAHLDVLGERNRTPKGIKLMPVPMAC